MKKESFYLTPGIKTVEILVKSSILSLSLDGENEGYSSNDGQYDSMGGNEDVTEVGGAW